MQAENTGGKTGFPKNHLMVMLINKQNKILFLFFFVLQFISLSAQESDSDFIGICKNSGNDETIRALLESGASWQVLARTAEGEQIISADVHRSHAPLLMDWGMPVNIKDERGRTFLMKAADYGDVNLVLALLNPGGLVIAPNERARLETEIKRSAADPNITDNRGRTALMYAYNTEVVRLLAEAGADADAVNNEGLTPLMKEVKRSYENPERHNDLIKELLDLGADPHRKTPDGKNLLLLYIENHDLYRHSRDYAHPATVKLLLDLGMDPAEADESGKSALFIALEEDKSFSGVKEIQSLLLAASGKKETAAIKKEVRRKRNGEYALTVPERLLQSAPLLLPLGYLGFSVAARENIYNDNPDSNWMGSVNAFMTGFIAGTAISSIPFLLWTIIEDGWDRLLPLLFCILIPPIAGIITGGFWGNNSAYSSAFREKPGLYYISPALAGAICIPILIYIWRR
jgi:ankyrin repeat protein